MKFRNTLWWVLFFIISILLQKAFPGIDTLVIGLLISLEERSPLQTLWVLLTIIIIQEGCGTLDFGVSILWYSCVIGLFFIGCWLFETKNFLFIILLSIAIGITKFFVITLVSHLQNLPDNTSLLINECMLQALYIPIAWKLISLTRSWVTKYEAEA